jgi:hypothetical protein
LVAQKSKLTDVLVDFQILPYELNFRVGVLDERGETLLYALDLLRNGAENTLFQTIELVETAPRSDLTQSDENTSHGLEIERLVATEDQHKSAKLHAQRLDRLGFACE